MPLTFNSGSSAPDWKAALSTLLDARKAKTEKSAEQQGPDKVKAPKTKSKPEPALRIEISEAAGKADAPAAKKAAAKTSVAAGKAGAEPAAGSPASKEANEGTGTRAAAISSAGQGSDAAPARVVPQAADVADLKATPKSQDAAVQPSADETEASDIAAARAAAIRLQETSRQQSLVSAISATPDSGASLARIAPITSQSAARAGLAYEAGGAAPGGVSTSASANAPASARADIAA